MECIFCRFIIHGTISTHEYYASAKYAPYEYYESAKYEPGSVSKWSNQILFFFKKVSGKSHLKKNNLISVLSTSAFPEFLLGISVIL